VQRVRRESVLAATLRLRRETPPNLEFRDLDELDPFSHEDFFGLATHPGHDLGQGSLDSLVSGVSDSASERLDQHPDPAVVRRRRILRDTFRSSAIPIIASALHGHIALQTSHMDDQMRAETANARKLLVQIADATGHSSLWTEWVIERAAKRIASIRVSEHVAENEGSKTRSRRSSRITLVDDPMAKGRAPAPGQSGPG